MSCSIRRFKCDTYPEKIENTENVKKLNTDLAKLMAERSMLDNKYFPGAQTSVSNIRPVGVNTIQHSTPIVHKR